MEQTDRTLIDTLNNYNYELSNEEKFNEKEIKNTFDQNHINIWKWENVTIQEKLGSGGFSKVNKGIYKDKEYAIKEMIIFKTEWDQLLNELLVMKRFNNDNFVQMRAISYKIQDNGSLIIRIIMELLDFDLNQYIYEQDKNSSEVIRFSIQILEALDEMHEQELIHRDIKPQNILIKEDQNSLKSAKLADFGIALKQQDQNYNLDADIQFTKSYISYEVVKDRILTVKTDIWSFGLVLFELCTGVKPYSKNLMSFQKSKKDILEQIENYDTPFYQDWEQTVGNQILIKIIKDCVNLGQSYEKRPDAFDLVKRLKLIDPQNVIFQDNPFTYENLDEEEQKNNQDQQQQQQQDQIDIYQMQSDDEDQDEQDESLQKQNSSEAEQSQQLKCSKHSSIKHTKKCIKHRRNRKLNLKPQERIKVNFDQQRISKEFQLFKSILKGSNNQSFQGDWAFVTPFLDLQKLNFITFKILNISNEIRFGFFGDGNQICYLNNKGEISDQNGKISQTNVVFQKENQIITCFNPYMMQISFINNNTKQFYMLDNFKNFQSFQVGVFLQDNSIVKIMKAKLQQLNDEEVQMLKQSEDKRSKSGIMPSQKYMKSQIIQKIEKVRKQQLLQQNLPQNSQDFIFKDFKNEFMKFEDNNSKVVYNPNNLQLQGNLSGYWQHIQPILSENNPNQIKFQIQKQQTQNMCIGIINLSYCDLQGKFGYGTQHNKMEGCIFISGSGLVFKNSQKCKYSKRFGFKQGDIVGINYSPSEYQITFINYTQDLIYSIGRLQIYKGNYIFSTYMEKNGGEIKIV